MLLHSLQLEGWRRFADPVSVGPFSPGLNIVHGPNGSGKSTLMMALVRAMFDGHHTAGHDVELLRPWGKELSPYVKLEFEHEGQTYRLEKGFLGRKGTELWRKEDGSFERFKEGRNADQYLRELLSGDEVGRGASKPQHWGLAQVLWVSQGDLKIETLEGSARDMVQQALGAQLATVESSGVEEKINDLFETMFTATGKLKAGAAAAPVVQLDHQTTVATALVATLRERLTAFETASSRIENLRQAAEQAQRREREVMATLAGTRGKSHEFLEVSGRCQTLRQEMGAAKAKADDARNRLEQIATSRKDLAEDEAKLARLQTEHPPLEAAVKQCAEREQATRAHATSIRAQRSEIDHARHAAHDAQALSDASRRAQQISAQIATVEEAQQQLAQLREQRTRIAAPTLKQLAALRKAENDLRHARVRLEAALVTLTFEAEERFEVLTLVGEPAGNNLVEPGARLVIRGAPETALYLPGVGTIRAVGPASSAEQLRAELAAAEAQHHRLAIVFGEVPLEQLEELQAQAQQLDGQIAQWQTRISTTLDGKTLEQLRFELTLADRTRTEIFARQTAWSESPPSSTELHAAAERLDHAFRAQIDDAEAKVEAARTARDAAERQVSLNNSQTTDTLQRIAKAGKQLETLTADGRDELRRQADYQDLLLALDMARAKLAKAELELAAFTGDPRKEESALEKEATSLRNEVSRASEALHREEAVLEQIEGEAPYSAVAAAEEELAELEAKLARERLAAEAIKLLHDTLDEVKRETVRTVIDPVKRRAQELLERIAGSKFERITFGEHLLPEGVCPQQVEGTSVSLDQLSGGEKEQVYFAVRMALADLVFRDRRELVVLDDVFVNSDSTRIARIITLLEEAAERYQIVLLTCHPERYRDCPKARFFDLAELTRDQTAARPATIGVALPAPALLAPSPIAAPSPARPSVRDKPVAKPDRSSVPPSKAKSARSRSFWESEAVEK